MEWIDLVTLQQNVKDGLCELFPDKVWVKAEIASIQVRTNGHCYLDLCQSSGGKLQAKVKAIIWNYNYPMLSRFYREATGSALEVGQDILVQTQINYSELYGLSLIIDDINPEFTIGEAELQKQRTIAQLKEDGMLEKQHELELPELPRRLAVISAADAAGFGDFVRHLTENEYGFTFDVQLFPATMQGAGAPESICDALSQIECSEEPFDAALIIRGGGSNLDLACFDDYGLALAIAGFPIPVLTAIGHDRDYHVADMVAHTFVKTPTALSDLFIDCLVAEDERISSYENRLRVAFASKIALQEARLDALWQRVRSADPRQVLSRGYTLVTNAGGVVTKSAKALKEGDEVRLLFADGEVEAIVTSKK